MFLERSDDACGDTREIKNIEQTPNTVSLTLNYEESSKDKIVER